MFFTAMTGASGSSSKAWAYSYQKQAWMTKPLSSHIDTILLSFVIPLLNVHWVISSTLKTIPIRSIDLVLSNSFTSWRLMKLNPFALIESSSGTSTISPCLSKTRQKSFFIEVYLWLANFTVPLENRKILPS